MQTAHDPPGRKPRDACHETGADQAADGLGPTVLAEEARGVRADAEEGGVAERRDAAVAEQQIQGQRKQPQIRICDSRTRLLFGMKKRTAQAAQKASSQGSSASAS